MKFKLEKVTNLNLSIIYIHAFCLHMYSLSSAAGWSDDSIPIQFPKHFFYLFFHFPECIFRITSWHLKCNTYVSKLNVSCIRLTAVKRHEHDWLHPTRIIHYSIMRASSKKHSYRNGSFILMLKRRKTLQRIFHSYYRRTWIIIFPAIPFQSVERGRWR